MQSQLNDKHQEVEAWLAKVFASRPVPQHEINSRTLDLLIELKHTCDQQDKNVELILQDHQLKTQEYAVEAERIGKVLDRFGLKTSSLSQSGNISLKTLVDICMILNIQQATDPSFLVAMTSLADERLKVENLRPVEQRLHKKLLAKTTAQMQQIAQLETMLENADKLSEELLPELEKKAKQAEFLQQKSREYRRTINQLQKELTAAHVEPSIYHGTLVKKSEGLKELKARLQTVQAKLDSYHALPPDLSLARVKVEETKQELANLEAELTQHIDLMHI